MEILFGFVLGLGFWPLALIGMLFLAGVYTSHRTRDFDNYGWLIVLSIVAGAAAYAINQPDLKTIVEYVTSASLWKAIGVYMLAGLLYCWLIEFPLTVRREARRVADKWAKQTDKTTAFGLSNSLFKYDIVGHRPIPIVERAELVATSIAWTIWWPLYLASLILGDLLSLGAEWIVARLGGYARRVVNYFFAQAFAEKQQ